MQDFIDQAHGIYFARPDCGFREIDNISFLVYFLCKNPGGMKIGKDYISADLKEGFVEAVFLPGFAGDMEFVKIVLQTY